MEEGEAGEDDDLLEEEEEEAEQEEEEEEIEEYWNIRFDDGQLRSMILGHSQRVCGPSELFAAADATVGSPGARSHPHSPETFQVGRKKHEELHEMSA